MRWFERLVTGNIQTRCTPCMSNHRTGLTQMPPQLPSIIPSSTWKYKLNHKQWHPKRVWCEPAHPLSPVPLCLCHLSQRQHVSSFNLSDWIVLCSIYAVWLIWNSCQIPLLWHLCEEDLAASPVFWSMDWPFLKLKRILDTEYWKLHSVIWI